MSADPSLYNLPCCLATQPVKGHLTSEQTSWGPPRLTATRDLGMPQTGPIGGDVWGVNEKPWWGPRWGCCLYIPVVGQMRRPCCKPAPPTRAWDWNFSLIARVRRKWNFEVYLTILRSIFYYFWTRFESEQATVGQGNSSINGYIQDVKKIYSDIGNILKNSDY